MRGNYFLHSSGDSPFRSSFILRNRQALLIILFCIAIFLTGIVCLSLGVDKTIYFLWMTILSFSFLSLSKIEWAVALFLLVAPLQFVVRIGAPYDPFLALWRSYLYIILFFVWFMMFCMRRFKFPDSRWAVIILLFNSIGLINIINSPTITVGLSGFREVVRFSGLYIIIYSLLMYNEENAKIFIYSIISGGIIAGIIQLCGYLTDSKIVTGIVYEAGTRPIFGIRIPRMASIILGGPSSIGTLLSATGIMCLANSFKNNKKWILISLFLFSVALLTLAQTTFIAIITGLLVVLVGSYKQKIPIVNKALIFLLFIGAIIIFLIPGAWIGAYDIYKRGIHLLTYWWNILYQNLEILFIGNGFRTSSPYLIQRFYSTYNEISSSVDWGWAGLIWQMGFPISILMVLFLFIIPFKGIKAFQKNVEVQYNDLLLTSSAGMIVFAMDFHSIPWTRAGADSSLFALAAIITFYLKTRFVQANIR